MKTVSLNQNDCTSPTKERGKMARDVEVLSEKATDFLWKLKPHFPKGPFGNPAWTKEGIVTDNGQYDLRKSADRDRLKKKHKSMVGYLVELQAISFMREHPTLDGFSVELSPLMRKTIEIILILKDLDVQIETMDFAGE